MPRSFLVDSLVLREAGEKKAPEGSPPPLFPYAVPPPHALHGLSPGACHARKAGLLCVCPLCVTASQLHGPPGPPALPLLKASFPPFGSQYCHAPLGRQHSAVSPGVAHGPAAAAAALYQTSYSLPDPRQFHCISVGKPRGGAGRGQTKVGQAGMGDEDPGLLGAITLGGVLLESWDWTPAGRARQEVPIPAGTSRRERGLGRRALHGVRGLVTPGVPGVPRLGEEADRD